MASQRRPAGGAASWPWGFRGTQARGLVGRLAKGSRDGGPPQGRRWSHEDEVAPGAPSLARTTLFARDRLPGPGRPGQRRAF